MRGSTFIALFAVVALCVGSPAAAQTMKFVDVTASAGFDYKHGYIGGPTDGPRVMSAGVAAGDYDNDGWVDLFIARGNIGPNLLYRNMGDGTFVDVAEAVGLDLPGTKFVSPTFADVDGDGRLDLLVGGIERTTLSLYRNRPDGTFEDVTSTARFFSTRDTYSAAFGDYDLDGDLDLCQSHWGSPGTGTTHLWRNEGGMRFTSVDRHARVTGIYYYTGWDFTFTPNFADINNDGWPDLLMASDFNTSQVLLNEKDGTFNNVTDPEVITDENGMGAAIGDYDNDGDLDWFVSSIWDPFGFPDITVEDPRDTVIGKNWGQSGNRFYRNDGDGIFANVTDLTGTRKGDWGWGSAFVDVNNDGHLDLFHVNGFVNITFATDRARLFVSNGDGTFDERGAEFGIDDTGQGRGIACLDFDQDGDIDIFIANNHQRPKLYRNDGGNRLGNYMGVRLEGEAPNTEAIGGRIYVTDRGVTQMRELRAGSNFSSQDPAHAHFGLGPTVNVDEVRLVWPDGTEHVFNDVPANRTVTYNLAELRQTVPTPKLSMTTWPVPSRGLVQFAWPATSTSSVLQIYDITGARVWETSVPAGTATTQWDGKDTSGRVLKPGVYHARLSNTGAEFTSKFVLAP